MKTKYINLLIILIVIFASACTQEKAERTTYSRTELIHPIHKNEFRANSCNQKIQGGNPQILNGYLVFNGNMDGNRQVDPQIAVGGGYVFHATNTGLAVYDKEGNYLDGVSQNCFNRGIDPKLFFDVHNRVFCFDLWNPWDKEKKKPVNVAVSETSNPLKAWNIYPVPVPEEVDGGGIGYSGKWLGYSFPGGEDRTFVMRMDELISGEPAHVYFFKGSLGHPVFTQDKTDDLYFFEINKKSFVIKKVLLDKDGKPAWELVSDREHGLAYTNWPPKSPQKGTNQLTASGDRNPKNLVFQGGHIWFSHAVNYNGRSAVQWHQVKPDGEIVQSGLISSDTSSYIQTTIAVNKNNDVLIGFQETSENMYISPRFTYRLASDPAGTTREIVSLGEGKGATDGVSWGDYSGSIIDGDDLTRLWTIQSIANKDGKGETVISRFIP